MPHAPPIVGRYGKRPHSRMRRLQLRTVHDLISSPRTAGLSNRARRELNNDTIRELHAAFRRGGAKAINKVMNNNPAMFLKLLVLLVPREMQIEHSGGIKAMTTEQIERSIEIHRYRGVIAVHAAAGKHVRAD